MKFQNIVAATVSVLAVSVANAPKASATFDCAVTGSSGGLLFFAGGVFSPFQLAACGLTSTGVPILPPVVAPPVVVPPVAPPVVVPPSGMSPVMEMAQSQPAGLGPVPADLGATLIPAAAAVLIVQGIIIPVLNGTNMPPAGPNLLTCEGFIAPSSGKAFRFQPNRAKYNTPKECLPVAKVEPDTAAPKFLAPPSEPKMAAPKFLAPPSEPKPVAPKVKKLPSKG